MNTTTPAIDYLNLLYQRVPDGHLAVSWIENGEFLSQSFAVETQLADAAVFAESKGQSFHTYARICLLDTPVVNAKARGRATDSRWMPAIWLDLDTDDGVHGNHKLPMPTREEALVLLKKVLPVDPSILIDSGGGYYPLCLLADPLDLHDAGDLKTAKDLLARLKQAAVNAFTDAGRHLDKGVFELARVLRVPGTMNHKFTPPRPARVIESAERFYTVDDLLEYLPELEPSPAAKPAQSLASFTATPPNAVERCKAYLSKMPDAVSGEGGHDATFAAACECFKFGLSDGDARSVMDWFNTSKCRPVWTDAELQHKLEDAKSRVATDGEPGCRLIEKREAASDKLDMIGAGLRPTGAAVTVMPVVEGLHIGGGVALKPVEVRQTPTKRMLRAEVSINGVGTDMEIVASDNPTGIRDAWASLLEIADLTNAEIGDDAKVGLKMLLTRARLEAIRKQLSDAAPPPMPKVGASLLEKTHRFMLKGLDIRFVSGDPAGLWSERLGRLLRRSDFVNHCPADLLDIIKDCHDYPEPTDADPTKPIKQVSQVLKVVWSDLVEQMPREVDAGLDATSKAAAAFKAALVSLWNAPETWMKFDTDAEAGKHTARMSLASRARELSGVRTDQWRRVLKGCNAFMNVTGGEVWLGLRYDLLAGEIRGHTLPGVASQSDLHKLGLDYGVLDPIRTGERFSEGNGAGRERGRLAVLTREICDLLIDCKESVPFSTDANGTEVVEGLTFDPVTGLVVEAETHE